jgi:hypothetical protein
MALKALKAIRPLKMAKTKGLRESSDGIIKAFEDLAYICVLDILILLIFGIIGV